MSGSAGLLFEHSLTRVCDGEDDFTAVSDGSTDAPNESALFSAVRQFHYAVVIHLHALSHGGDSGQAWCRQALNGQQQLILLVMVALGPCIFLHVPQILAELVAKFSESNVLRMVQRTWFRRRGHVELNSLSICSRSSFGIGQRGSCKPLFVLCRRVAADGKCQFNTLTSLWRAKRGRAGSSTMLNACRLLVAFPEKPEVRFESIITRYRHEQGELRLMCFHYGGIQFASRQGAAPA